jgi:hypothetical protein
MNSMTWEPESRRGVQVFTGIVFVTIGAVLLLGNFNFLQLRPLLSQWWPLILVVVGIKHLVLWRGSVAWVSGLFWIGSGGLFLASRLGYLQVRTTSIIWPLMVIWFGILVAMGPCGPDSIGDGSKT